MNTTAIILAAGKGTRMKTDLPKVLHPVCNRPMLAYVLDACRAVNCAKLVVVIGYGGDQIRQAFAGQNDIVWVEQTQQHGTGHAAQVCIPALQGLTGEVLVLAGDGPLVQAPTLAELLDIHRRRQAACTLATSLLPEPGNYGRIVRDKTGELVGIVEYLDATEEQHKIQEVNVSLYCFDIPLLLQVLPDLKNDNAKGEYYLTDTLGMLKARGYRLAAVPAVPPEDVLSINDRVQLAEVNRVLQKRIQNELMLSGVTIEDPGTTWIDPRARIGRDTTIRAMTVIDGPCRIGAGCTVGPMAHLRECTVADQQTVEHVHG